MMQVGCLTMAIIVCLLMWQDASTLALYSGSPVHLKHLLLMEIHYFPFDVVFVL